MPEDQQKLQQQQQEQQFQLSQKSGSPPVEQQPTKSPEKFQNTLESEEVRIQKNQKVVFAPKQGSNQKTGKNLQGKKINNIDFDQMLFDDPFGAPETSEAPKSTDLYSGQIVMPKYNGI